MKGVFEKIRKLDSAQGYLLTSKENVMYACGFTGDSSELLLSEAGAYFFTDSRYTLQAVRDMGKSAEIVTTSGADRDAAIGNVLKKECVRMLALEKEDISLSRFEGFRDVFCVEEYVDISPDMLQMRSVKTDEEIEKIEAAMRAGESALKELIPYIRPGVSELDIRAELLYHINKLGMDSAFEPIVAAGENSALPHAIPSANILKNGDLLTLDFGCKYMGYCSDMTRTFGIGNIDGELKKIYDIVKEAHERALAVSLGEEKAGAIDAAAREFIEKSGYGQYFGHGTGHGVGLQIHEKPVLNATSQDIMHKNMVYTVEPGIYLPGRGGVRIEDTCVYGRGSINSFSKELILIQ